MTIVDVTVCTPSLPHRSDMLNECMQSVRSQTWQPKSHLIGLDYERLGPAKTANKLYSQATTEWVISLADDDLLYPSFIETLLSQADDADMIYPWCEVIGTRNGWNPNSYFDADRLRDNNYIPATVLIRKSAWEDVGGFPEVLLEDHEMWIKLMDAGKKIKCVPEILWQYRFHGKNISDGHDPTQV